MNISCIWLLLKQKRSIKPETKKEAEERKINWHIEKWERII